MSTKAPSKPRLTKKAVKLVDESDARREAKRATIRKLDARNTGVGIYTPPGMSHSLTSEFADA